ncbi:hypothetical protein TVAG_507200 [Trichomonas vaginalis G3]|uniref:Uncharacterized protein n=1 Tax=Trichomonas vaginalis (strain ATCC PRA-98 / G3) TaxID=412133 RepID=A2GQY9_TRIV3|nr:hypothetical protein TVAGG3_0826640 [Trichomonas vaginalis G3]EAX80430.1 hypothetical protein TVAG_507200 [Trichomonas vaginalis G3]KAI5498289.1 hypothetical protein TVAGG3_0826640 [Trichomonas vaginalis G3]|eukprot:XP_001293360.1 hypothetical protein [Trichomonas vaginalis G3]
MEGFEFMPLASKEDAEEVVVAAWNAISHVDAFHAYQDDLEKEGRKLGKIQMLLEFFRGNLAQKYEKKE